MTIKCCLYCVAPKRHPGCHGDCPEYLQEREALDEELKKAREDTVGSAVGYIADTQKKIKEHRIRGRKRL